MTEANSWGWLTPSLRSSKIQAKNKQYRAQMHSLWKDGRSQQSMEVEAWWSGDALANGELYHVQDIHNWHGYWGGMPFPSGQWLIRDNFILQEDNDTEHSSYTVVVQSSIKLKQVVLDLNISTFNVVALTSCYFPSMQGNKEEILFLQLLEDSHMI